jgi:endonuclease/exonuclease/phosphatase family metal-dependent hydrolase
MYKTLQLNTWCGRSNSFAEDFMMLMQEQPDIITLQEVLEEYSNNTTRTSFNSIPNMSGWLHQNFWDEYEFYYSPRVSSWPPYSIYAADHPGTTEKTTYGHWGNMVMWRRDKFSMLTATTKFILGTHDSFDHVDHKTIPVNIQGVVLRDKDGIDLLIGNIHGWYGGRSYGKGDSEERIKQSHEIVTFLKSFQHVSGIILAGDLNIRPQTESLRIIEEEIGDNVITKFNIATTRTELYGIEKRNLEPHANYVFVDNRLKTYSCVVDPGNSVSDHAPIFVRFGFGD